ncbi:hypothetical protein [Streptomyces tendae]|nr:hypothetical protein [Streptomyces tendae]
MSGRRIRITYRTAAAIARPLVLLLFRRQRSGAHHFPAEGGFVAAVNHNS